MPNPNRGDDSGGAPPAPPPLELEVRGMRPVPKGAVSAFVVPGKSGKRARAVVVQGGSKAKRSALAEWSSAIQDAALVAVGAGDRELEVARFVGMAVDVAIEFRLARPKSHYGTGKNADRLKVDAPPFPTKTPDIDKLTRAILDALIGVAFDDDSRVAHLTARKVYASVEGARIRVRAMSDAEVLFERELEAARNDRRAESPPCSECGGPCFVIDADGRARSCSKCTPQLGLMGAALIAPPPPSDRRTAARDRIRKIIGGTPIDAELKVDRELRGHALERHTPIATLDDIMTDVAHAQAGVPLPPRLEVLEELVERDPFLSAAVADRVAEIAGCDGDHPEPACADSHCWRRDPIDVAIAAGDRAELARRFLEVDPRHPDHKRLIAALSTNIPPAPPPADEDDFG